MRSIVTAFFFVLVFEQDESVFSFNSILNDYVSTHHEKLKCISITNVTSSDLVFQQAFFRSFDAVKKREVWSNQLKTVYAWYMNPSGKGQEAQPPSCHNFLPDTLPKKERR